MKLNALFSSDAFFLPWPTLVDGVEAKQSRMAVSSRCAVKCPNFRRCADVRSEGEFVCEFGFSVFVTHIGQHQITVYGVRSASNPNMPGKRKPWMKGRFVPFEEFKKWTKSLSSLLDAFDKNFLERQAEMLDPLHDPMRLAKQINNIASRLVQLEADNRSFDCALESASYELKTLVKASGLLSDSFDLLEIYFNPAAATYGRLVSTNIHGLLTKLVAIFRIDDAEGQAPRIYFDGECYRKLTVYESFKLIPFALLSNAVKYSLEGDVRVRIEDHRPTVRVSVESIGPYIEEDERPIIFERRVRGRWAAEVKDGRGVGLYLADVIAQAHGIEITVASSKLERFCESVPLARNVFTFEVDPHRAIASVR